MVACALVVWSLALSDGMPPAEATVFKPAPPAAPLPTPPVVPPPPSPGLPASPAVAAPPTPAPEPRAQSIPPAASPRIFQAPPPREPAGQPSLRAQVAAISKRWYGWQLILSDAAFCVLGTLTQHGPATVVASAGVTLGAPALHFANGDGVGGSISLVVRGGLMAATIAAGYHWEPAKDPCNRVEDCNSQIFDGQKLLVTLADALFLVLDDTLLSRRGDPAADGAHRAQSLALVPTLAPLRGGGGMAGLVANF